jgi:hypothetical protein
MEIKKLSSGRYIVPQQGYNSTVIGTPSFDLTKEEIILNPPLFAVQSFCAWLNCFYLLSKSKSAIVCFCVSLPNIQI